MPPNKLQKEAIEYLSGPLLVIAGPGTGKTQLLSKKVEYILENTDANPENILCLTFTESGAQNMRERLYSMIGRAAAKVQIHTYHALGSDILASYRNYATEFTRALDNPVDEILQYKIIKEIQDELPARDILRGDSISDIIDTIGSAKSARLSSSDLEKIAKANIENSREMNAELSGVLDGLNGKSLRFPAAVEQVYGPLREALAKYVSKQPIVKGIENEANVYLFELDQIISAEEVKEKPSSSPLSRWKDKRFEKNEDGNYRLKNVVSNKKLLSLASVMAKYDAYLEREGLFDFSDMIEEAIRILKEDKGFLATLSERYQYVLLDEFQDTNPSQAELIY
ncbi:MAG: UvrD-helicase domain-containing protein, partial [Candidatus Saccharibacteria bacterium]|nr:UvrD-helicase domain-containing protein [Candidatus Saccharibacteria bacterium]